MKDFEDFINEYEKLNNKLNIKNKEKILKNNYKELKNIYVDYIKLKEKNNNKFSQSRVIKNVKINKLFVIKNSFKDYIVNYYNLIIQQLIYNKIISQENGLIPFFITFTLPSQYQPFKTTKSGKRLSYKDWKINPNYLGDLDLKKQIGKNYKILYNIFRSFYLDLKKGNKKLFKYGKKVRYNYFIEFHKSFNPHIHIIFYIPIQLKDWIYEVYFRTLKKFNMNTKSNKIIEIIDKEDKNGNKINSLDGSVNYISKYITKSLKKLDNEEELYLFLGWKSYNKIRIFGGSRTKIGISNYKKIYYLLDKKEKEELLKKVKKDNTCLLYQLEKITYVYKNTRYSDGKIKTKEIGDKNNYKYFVYLERERKEKFNYVNLYFYFRELREFLNNIYINIDRTIVKNKYNNVLNLINNYVSKFNLYVKFYLSSKNHFNFEDYLRINKRELNFNLNKKGFLKNIIEKIEKNFSDIRELLEYFYYFIREFNFDEFLLLTKNFNGFERNENFETYKNRIKQIFEKNINKFNFSYFKLINYLLDVFLIERDGEEIYNKQDWELRYSIEFVS